MKKLMTTVLAVMLCLTLLVGLQPLTVAAEETAEKGVADLAPNRFDPAVTPRSETNENMPLVIADEEFSGVFSPFFYTSNSDGNVEAMTQLGLCTTDPKGFVVAGNEWPCLAYSYTNVPAEDMSTTTYKFILKNGLTFSDGTPVTLKDVLFNFYVYCDPLYDGISTMYTIPIQGIDEYRLQTSSEKIELVAKILEAGISDKDGEMVIEPADGVDMADQEAFWSHLPEAGAKFAQEIIDYVVNNYGNEIEDNMAPFKAEDLEKPSVAAAYGMVMWGFGEVDDQTGKFTDKMGKEYDLSADTVDATTYWNNILDAYGYDLSDAGINAEKAGDKHLEDYVKELYIAKEGQIEGGVKEIKGISTGKEVCEDGVEREYIQFVINGVDPVAIQKLSINVAPMHYYTEGFKGELDEHGVSVGNPEFIQCLKDKNDKPMGAGPYIFESYENKVVSYVAFDGFCMGAPKIKHLRRQAITLGSELDAVKTGTVHVATPSATTEIVNDITSGEGDFAKMSYVLVDNDGYGCIGIQGQYFPDWNVRKAIAHALNVQLTIDDYYGELASVNYRTMTKVQWAYPENPEPLYPYDGTGETSKQLLLDAGYIYDEASNVMSYPKDDERAGEQFTIRFTLPSDAKDHPAGAVALDFQKVMASIGVKVEIDADPNMLSKLGTAYESGLQMWAAAWGNGGVDPDMFQIWYSDPSVNNADSPKRSGMTYLFQNGSEDQKEAIRKMDDLIIAGTKTLDRDERKQIYKEALELSTGMAVEVPTYQRKNMDIYNKTVLNPDSLVPNEKISPFYNAIGAEIWNLELLDQK
ncbi:MAG: ABC transporter substrate-binding protein [Clostridiales bacterium]|nr:ABC transporter substrate-binding protein [Clostridiales bacterium]